MNIGLGRIKYIQQVQAMDCTPSYIKEWLMWKCITLWWQQMMFGTIMLNKLFGQLKIYLKFDIGIVIKSKFIF